MLSTTRFSAIAAAACTAAALAFTSPAARADNADEIREKLSGASLTLIEAIDRGLQEVPGHVIDAELDRDDGVVRYELEIITAQGENFEVDINAANGELHKFKNDGKASRRDQQRLGDARIDIKRAIEAAVQHTPGTAYAAQLDSHWGDVVYEVDILQQDGRVFEIKVNAADGQVIRARED